MSDSNPIDFPELANGFLSDEELDALFADLKACTKVTGILVQNRRREEAQAHGQVDLGTARNLLRERSVRGVQIRYLWDDSEWWDTLMVTPEGIRVVRIRHETAG